MYIKIFLWLVLFCTFFPEHYFSDCHKEPKCKTTRVHGLRTSDCYHLDFREFPKCLPTNTQVVELSYNRIRKVSNQDLQRYPSIAHLYLTDNLIVNLEDDTFRDLTSLETLDLSVNAIGKVPAAIFQLPSLKTLYLSRNLNINITESVEEAKPIGHSSLTKLDISYITEEGALTVFPDFAELPMLAFLNISGDQFSYVSTKHFASLCNLQVLANVNVTAEFQNHCDCWKINKWLTERNVKFTAFLCPFSDKDCQDQPINAEDVDVYQKCKETFQAIERKMLLNKIGLWVGVTLAVILLLAIIYGYRKCRKSRQQKRASEIAQAKALQERDQFHLLNN